MLSTRDRLFAFVPVAFPALCAFLLGRFLAGLGRAIHNIQLPESLPSWATRFLSFTTATESHSAAFQTFGNWLAVAISVIGFLIVHRLDGLRAYRALTIHLTVSWSVQALILLLTVISVCELLTSQG